MDAAKIARQDIIDAMADGLAKEEFIRAAWLGGSDASGRTDELSDVDIQLIVEDEHVEEAFDLLHGILDGLSPITRRFRFPEPTWHGHSQEVLALRDADPCHFLDIVVLKKSAPDRFLERERHGEPMLLFDREDLLVPPPLDWDKHREKILARIETIRSHYELFQPMVTKAARRGHHLDALFAYVGVTLRPLIELLRMRYCPERFDYGPRYLDRDLPDEWRVEMEKLAHPSDLEQIEAFRLRAVGYFRKHLDDYDNGEWRIPENSPEA